MAHDNDYRLLSKAILDRDITRMLEVGIQDDWFVDEDLRRIWVFVRNHYSKYREVPTLATVRANYPAWRALDVKDSLDYLIDEMVALRRKKLTLDGAANVVAQLQSNDHETALLEMQRTVTVVNEQGVIGSSHVDLTADPESRFAEYETLANSDGGLLGIPTGFEKIDEATAGLQGGQLVTIIAPPKTGKSQLALRSALNVHAAGHVPLFQSFEMNNHEQQQRADAMLAHISHARLRRGSLTDVEKQRYEATLKAMAGEKSFHLTDAVGGLTVSALLASIEQKKPDIVFVDGVYLMLDEVTGESNTPQALTNITRSLKRMAQNLDIPIVITTQTLLWKMKGGKVTADSIGYSSSFFQDSDVILGLEPVDGEDLIRLLKIVQSRNCPPSETSITWNWDRGCFHDELLQATCEFCNDANIWNSGA
jgi:replicative DNA helicase